MNYPLALFIAACACVVLLADIAWQLRTVIGLLGDLRHQGRHIWSELKSFDRADPHSPATSK